MKTPSTPEQLASAIESLVASYLDEVRVAAQHAVERTLSRRSLAPRVSKRRGPRPTAPKPATSRRTAAELDKACEQLCQVVRERPGESMLTLAEKMDAPAITLRRPMAQLRAEGRVRTVGERHLMRYFPAVVRPPASKD